MLTRPTPGRGAINCSIPSSASGSASSTANVSTWSAGTRPRCARCERAVRCADRLGLRGNLHLWEYCSELELIGDSLVLDISYPDEDGGHWFEGEARLSALAPLRDDLLAGDYRAPYNDQARQFVI
jgi:hypothetical protein